MVATSSRDQLWLPSYSWAPLLFHILNLNLSSTQHSSSLELDSSINLTSIQHFLFTTRITTSSYIMSDVQGFPPSASDYVLSDEMFNDDIQKATNPKDRARRQEAVRRVIGAFNRAKRSMSLWSVSMLWNYLRTTDWVCSERHVSKHPEGRFLLEQNASTRWPMDWYGRLFVIQATCHKTDQLDRIHREHASHWGCAYHKGRPFYPDLYRVNSRNSRRSGSPEHSVAPSTLSQDSISSLELDRGRSPPRPRSQSSTPTLANYDIIDPHHLEDAMPPSAMGQPTRSDRIRPEGPPVQVNGIMSSPKQQTQPVRTSRKASPRPSHSSSALSDPVFKRTQPASTNPEDPPAQVNRVISPPKQPTQPVHRSRKASPRPSHLSSALSDTAVKLLAALIPSLDRAISHGGVNQATQPTGTNPEVPQLGYTSDGAVNHDPPKPFLSTFPDLSIPATLQTSQVGRPARTSHKISRSAQADPTMPPPRSQTAVPARTNSEITSIPAYVHPTSPPHDLFQPRGIPPGDIPHHGYTMSHDGKSLPLVPGMHPADIPPASIPHPGYTISHDGGLIPAGMPLPTSHSVGQSMHVHGPRSIVANPHSPRPRSPRPIVQPMPVRGRRHSIITNPHSLRPHSPRHGVPHWSGRSTGPASSVPDVQSYMIQATQAAQQAIELSQRSLHHVRRLEDFSNTMSDYVQQSVIHAHRSKNYMDESAAVTKGIQEEIRGSMANNEAAVTTANRALSLVERLRQYFSIEP